ncbi:hypothetical protein SVAN01_02055 [Stagonosporopsis vannaccii]|nr:hypothetical protein SVAN01_02055 [Stagonosporopsis vannaccii]
MGQPAGQRCSARAQVQVQVQVQVRVCSVAAARGVEQERRKQQLFQGCSAGSTTANPARTRLVQRLTVGGRLSWKRARAAQCLRPCPRRGPQACSVAGAGDKCVMPSLARAIAVWGLRAPPQQAARDGERAEQAATARFFCRGRPLLLRAVPEPLPRPLLPSARPPAACVAATPPRFERHPGSPAAAHSSTKCAQRAHPALQGPTAGFNRNFSYLSNVYSRLLLRAMLPAVTLAPAEAQGQDELPTHSLSACAVPLRAPLALLQQPPIRTRASRPPTAASSLVTKQRPICPPVVKHDTPDHRRTGTKPCSAVRLAMHNVDDCTHPTPVLVIAALRRSLDALTTLALPLCVNVNTAREDAIFTRLMVLSW